MASPIVPLSRAGSRDNPRRGIGRTAGRAVDRLVLRGAAALGVERFKPSGFSSAGNDLIFASGDKLLFFIAGLLFARKTFTVVDLVQLNTAKSGLRLKVSVQ
jgi:hypothetical protein